VKFDRRSFIVAGAAALLRAPVGTRVNVLEQVE
jgi:hypothetical protein